MPSSKREFQKDFKNLTFNSDAILWLLLLLLLLFPLDNSDSFHNMKRNVTSKYF